MVGGMDQQHQYCHAFKYKGESDGIWYVSEQIPQSLLNPQPEPLNTLLAGVKLFLRKIRKVNSCFQMTSFGATKFFHNKDGRNFESIYIQDSMSSVPPNMLITSNAWSRSRILWTLLYGRLEKNKLIHDVFTTIQSRWRSEESLKFWSVVANKNQLVRLFKPLSNRLQSDYCVIDFNTAKACRPISCSNCDWSCSCYYWCYNWPSRCTYITQRQYRANNSR